MNTLNTPCPECGFPLPAPTQQGEQVSCPYCHTISTAISAEIPNCVIACFACFAAGVILGPAVYQALQGTSAFLARQAKERIR